MRPIHPHAARLMAISGLLGIATTLAVSPGTAQSEDTTGTTTPAAQAGAADAAATPAATTATVAATKAHAKLRIHHAARNVLVGRRITVRGALRADGKSHTVALQTRRGHRWVTVDRARTRGSHGAFRLRYRARHLGSRSLRVSFPGDRTARATHRALGRLNVYRKVSVSWYNAAGGRLGCGGTGRPGELGVAHKTLPCGTKVTLRYHGHTVRVPVIDRGPYVGGREYDLTGPTKAALHMGDLATVMATR